VEYISKETSTIYTTISKIEKELALTEEYKTALIAEAVTGKIDVRGYEVPEISEEETYEEIEEEISMAAEDEETYQNIIE
jgi:type I restriction enzyme S subunit